MTKTDELKEVFDQVLGLPKDKQLDYLYRTLGGMEYLFSSGSINKTAILKIYKYALDKTKNNI